jgi:ATP synthase protein I
MTEIPPEPHDLKALGEKLDEARRREGKRDQSPPPSQLGIAFRFTTELVSALVVGGGLGWLLDRLFHTKPIFIVVMFCLGAAAGIRNVMRAAKEINAEIAAAPKAPAVKDDEE